MKKINIHDIYNPIMRQVAEVAWQLRIPEKKGMPISGFWYVQNNTIEKIPSVFNKAFEGNVYIGFILQDVINAILNAQKVLLRYNNRKL